MTTTSYMSIATATGSELQTKVSASTSFTPAVSFGGASVGITYSTQQGYYVRVGPIVHIFIRIVLSSKGSSTGTFAVSLPFTASSNITEYCLGPITAFTIVFPVGATMVSAILNGGTASLNAFSQGPASFTSVLTDTNFGNTTSFDICGSYLLA